MTLAFDPEIGAVLMAVMEMMEPPPLLPRGDWRGVRQQLDMVIPLMHAFMPVHDEVVRTDAALPNGVRLRWYAPPGGVASPGPAVLYIHGGGMVGGSLDLYDRMVAHYAALSAVPFLSVDYRLAPEHPHPAPVEDCLAGLLWLVEQAPRLGVDRARIAVMGDSAGGGLAAGVAHLARDRGITLKRQILLYPMLDSRTVTPDPELGALATWTYDNNFTGWQALLEEGFETRVPEAAAAPARAENVSGLAPAYIDVGTLDIFCAEDVEYARRLMAAHVPVELHVHEGAPHGFELLAPGAAVSGRAMADRVRVLRSL
jgi:acetyl esterase/lipase